MFRKSILAATLTTALFAMTLPRPAGDLTIKEPGKPDSKLSGYRGKIVILAFIDTTCSHCQHTTQVLEDIQREYFMRGVQVIEEAFNPSAQTGLANFNERFKPNFPVGLTDLQSMINYTQITAEMRPVPPVILFIDRKGVVRDEWLGNNPNMDPPENQPKNFRAEIDKLTK